MTSSKNALWNQFAFSRPMVALALTVAFTSTFANTQTSFAQDTASNTAVQTVEPAATAVAPDAPPAVVHEGTIVKTDIQASAEQTKSLEQPEKTKVENLSAPVPGNQDGAMPQPTFNALNTINTNVSNTSNASLTTNGSDASEASGDDYSVTKNVLTYPLNDPVNGQFTGQSSPPLALRENSDSAQMPTTVTQSKYQELPLSFEDARKRLSQLKLLAAGTRPQDALENVNQFIKWLSDIVDAHTKMATAFSKNEATKPFASSEKMMTTKFSHLRYESQLLKADLLIEERRHPEALAPLVEIVLAMPTSPLGKAAYQRLQELGFSSADAVSAVATTTSGAEPHVEEADSKIKSDVEKSPSVNTDQSAKKIALLPPAEVSKKSQAAKKPTNSKKSAKVNSRKSRKA